VEKNWSLARRQTALRSRAGLIRAIRRFFVARDYLEVETPHRIPAPAPESYIDAIPSGEWYLHPSPELCMKRLLAAGYEKIFQICRCWREGERGSLHLPEFTLLEWYRSGCNYLDLMDECEELVRDVARSMGSGGQIVFRGRSIDLTGPWERIAVEEAFRRYATLSVREALGKGVFDEAMVQEVEPQLGIERPTFVYDYPRERGALARMKEDNPDLAERFELYIGGLEIANAFSELIDPKEQRRRFEFEAAHRRSLGKAVYPMPERFLVELEAMPPSAGIALGVDRLVMALLDAPAIDDVVAFTPEEL
jgi:elongation factor P--(R)-beta-lysine ligase